MVSFGDRKVFIEVGCLHTADTKLEAVVDPIADEGIEDVQTAVASVDDRVEFHVPGNASREVPALARDDELGMQKTFVTAGKRSVIDLGQVMEG